MPLAQMVCMGMQVAPRLKQRIVILQIEMMGLQIHENKNGWHRRWKLPKGVKGILRL
jgi:hypothetical protein